MKFESLRILLIADQNASYSSFHLRNRLRGLEHRRAQTVKERGEASLGKV